MDYLALFMEYLQVELGLSDNTRISYQRDLRIFCKALSISEDKLADVQRSQIIGYITKLKLQGRAGRQQPSPGNWQPSKRFTVL